jgi:hypothetical protein
MDSQKFSKLKAAIKSRAESLKKSPNENETHHSQTKREVENMRSERKKIAEHLVSKGLTESFEDAEAIVDVMSEQWYNDLLEATSATRATVRALDKKRGLSQRLQAIEDRKADARQRAEERQKQRDKELEYVQTRKQNPELLRKEAQKRTLSTRMARAAQRLGLE